MAWAAVAACAAAADGSGRQSTTPFEPTVADMANPDRGFYGWAGSDFIADFDVGSVRAAYADGQRLVLANVGLGAWRATDLPPSLLHALDQNLAAVREAGMKTTLVFAYDKSGAGNDATATQIRRHLQQLAPVLAANADLIPFMRAGFIGAWGEWHSSRNGNSCGYQSGDTSCAHAAMQRALVRDALIANVPATTQIGFRYPADLQHWYPGGASPPQVGLHNDCFLAGPTDSGTYTAPGQRAYAQAITEHAAFGGETCDDAETPIRADCADILAEGARYHLAWLSRTYAKSVIANWQAQGCLAKVSASMGYRLQIDLVTHAAAVARGDVLSVGVDLRNVGWARMFTARALVLTLRNRADAAMLRASSGDLSRLPAQATAATHLTFDLTIPATAAPGTYDLLLAAPDIFPRTRDDPRFAVHFANADRPDLHQAWSPETGMFSVGSVVSIY